MKKFYSLLAGIIMMAIILFVPSFVDAGYNPNDIITDAYMHERGTMSQAEVQDFLEKQPGVLKSYKARDARGQVRPASEVIYNAANEFGLNPRVLLVMVEKEQSLLTNTRPSDKSLAWATGFGTYNHPRYGGFGNQVYYAAKVLGVDYDKYSDYYCSFQVGKRTATLDGYYVTPANNATRKLYIYNPLRGGPAPKHRFGANYLFWHLTHQRYAQAFKSYRGQGSVAGVAVNGDIRNYFYREGTVIESGGQKYLIDGGKKHQFTGPNSFKFRYSSSEVVSVPSGELALYKNGKSIGLPDGAVVQRAKGGAVYIVTDGKLRGIPDKQTLYNLGYSTGNIISVTDQEINLMAKGKPIDKNNITRQNGQLVQIMGQAGVYQYQNGVLYPIWDRKIKVVNFEYHGVAPISKSEASNYKIAADKPVLFRDGTLVMATDGPQKGVVFVVANSRRCGFKTRYAFDGAGYSLDNVVKVSNDVLRLHWEGQEIN